MKKQAAHKPKDNQNIAIVSKDQTSVVSPNEPSSKGPKTKNNDGGYIWLVS